jgi:hypothetical protein
MGKIAVRSITDVVVYRYLCLWHVQGWFKTTLDTGSALITTVDPPFIRLYSNDLHAFTIEQRSLSVFEKKSEKSYVTCCCCRVFLSAVFTEF